MKFVIYLSIILILLISSRLASVEKVNNSSSLPIIPDTTLGTTCELKIFENYSAVHINQQATSHEYNETFQQMLKAIHAKKYNATDVCFHNKHFLECAIDSQTCRCATTGIWSDFNYEQINNECYVGRRGRCHPNKTNFFVCVNGTKCTKTDYEYNSKKPQYICSGSLPPFSQIQGLFMWIIFVGMALLWRE